MICPNWEAIKCLFRCIDINLIELSWIIKLIPHTKYMSRTFKFANLIKKFDAYQSLMHRAFQLCQVLIAKIEFNLPEFKTTNHETFVKVLVCIQNKSRVIIKISDFSLAWSIVKGRIKRLR